MRKLLLLFFVIISQAVSAQVRNGIDLEGIWKNQDGEILHMKYGTFDRITADRNVSGVWVWETDTSIRVTRDTGEEYVLPLSVTGTTWVIHRPFSDKVWLWYKVQ